MHAYRFSSHVCIFIPNIHIYKLYKYGQIYINTLYKYIYILKIFILHLLFYKLLSHRYFKINVYLSSHNDLKIFHYMDMPYLFIRVFTVGHLYCFCIFTIINNTIIIYIFINLSICFLRTNTLRYVKLEILSPEDLKLRI